MQRLILTLNILILILLSFLIWRTYSKTEVTSVALQEQTEGTEDKELQKSILAESPYECIKQTNDDLVRALDNCKGDFLGIKKENFPLAIAMEREGLKKILRNRDTLYAIFGIDKGDDTKTPHLTVSLCRSMYKKSSVDPDETGRERWPDQSIIFYNNGNSRIKEILPETGKPCSEKMKPDPSKKSN